MSVLLLDGVIPDPISGLICIAGQGHILPLLVQVLFGAGHVLEVLVIGRVLHHSVVDLGLLRQFLKAGYGGLHTLDCQKGRQIGREGGQHQHDEQPVGRHQHPSRQGFRGFPATLGGERGKGKPKLSFRVKTRQG